MTQSISKSIGLLGLSLLLSTGPVLQGVSSAQPGPAQDSQTKKSSSSKTPAPSDVEIAAAKAKGMVWVNLASKIYHKEGKFYGKTKRGKFLSEDDAKKAGYREANSESVAKAKLKSADAKPK